MGSPSQVSCRRTIGIPGCVALGLAGCVSNHVEVTVRPGDDGSIDRSLRIWREDSSDDAPGPPEELLRAPRALYGNQGDATGPREISFRKIFDAVPSDLADGEATNHGTYRVLVSQLRTAHHYRERLPGRSDFDTWMREAGEFVDLLEWAVPDEFWQKARLGKVALSGKRLDEYARWDAGLPAKERERWRRGMDGLDPTRDLRTQLLALAEVASVDDLPSGPSTLAHALGPEDSGD